MSDLKAETERLQSLAREKAHADKLKTRITDENSKIAQRTTEYDELLAAYDQQVRSNQVLHDTGSKFREIYLKAEQLAEKKANFKEEMDLARENLQEIAGEICCPSREITLHELTVGCRHGRGAERAHENSRRSCHGSKAEEQGTTRSFGRCRRESQNLAHEPC